MIPGLHLIKLWPFLGLLSFALGYLSYSKNPPVTYSPDFCETENHTFEGGEVITYELYYNWGFIWIPAGEVVFSVVDKDPFMEIKAIGTTFPSYDSFYKVRDTFYSKIDKKTMLPVAFSRDIQEGKYTLYSEITFDQSNHKASSLVQKRGRTKNYEFDFANCMHDLLSILYYFRSIDYSNVAPKAEFPVNVLLDDEIYDLKVKYEGTDPKKKVKGMGKYNALHFSMNMVKSHIFKEGDQLQAWISNDQNKIALLVESPISVGSVKAVLTSYSGLKYPFEAKN